MPQPHLFSVYSIWTVLPPLPDKFADFAGKQSMGNSEQMSYLADGAYVWYNTFNMKPLPLNLKGDIYYEQRTVGRL